MYGGGGYPGHGMYGGGGYPGHGMYGGEGYPDHSMYTGWAIQVMEAQAILDMACLEDSAAASQAAAMEAIRAQ